MGDEEVVVVVQPVTDSVAVVDDSPIVSVAEVSREVIEAEAPVFVTVDRTVDQQVVVAAGGQGPQGIPGISSDATGQTKKAYTAGMALSGHRAVVLDDNSKLVYADPATAYHAERVLGVTLAAANVDEQVEVQLFGEAAEVSWTWTIHGNIYLGSNGVLTQAVPSSGALVKLGYATATNRMFVDIDNPIFLA